MGKEPTKQKREISFVLKGKHWKVLKTMNMSSLNKRIKEEQPLLWANNITKNEFQKCYLTKTREAYAELKENEDKK